MAGVTACDDAEEAPDATTVPTPPLGLTLALEVGAPQDSGGPIPLTLVLKNPNAAAVEFGLGGAGPPGWSGAFNFVVNDDLGEEIWLWYDLPILLQLAPVTLGGGQEMAFEGEWDRTDKDDSPVPPGTYNLFGRLRILVEQPDLEFGPEPFDLVTDAEEIEL
jgi:hypothetical protein